MSWIIWLHRNSIIFNNGSKGHEKVMELVKIRSWLWLSSKDKLFQASWQAWMDNPWMCLEENYR